MKMIGECQHLEMRQREIGMMVRRWMREFADRLLIRVYIYLHRYLHRRNVLPLDRNFGYSRGTPVGRYYVEKFLRESSGFVKGRCLEFGDHRYRSLFPNVSIYQVISIYAAPGVDYVCDIHDPVCLPEARFDSIICTQTIEHLVSPETAAKNLFRSLKPAGVLLLTAPFINNIHYDPTDFRRFSPEGVRLILESAGFVIEELDYGGNAAVSTGSLLGLATEDFSIEELDRKDPIYPYNVLVRARRPV